MLGNMAQKCVIKAILNQQNVHCLMAIDPIKPLLAPPRSVIINNGDNSSLPDYGGDSGASEEQSLQSKKNKRCRKKRPAKSVCPKPKPGQIQIVTDLNGTRLFCCPQCDIAYPEKYSLEQHLMSHQIERRFICEICGASLKRKEHLERHEFGHSSIRPFACTVCGKTFKRKEHLNLHVIIHSGEKTEVCRECGKAFYRRDHLRKHLATHLPKAKRAELLQQKRQHERQQQTTSSFYHHQHQQQHPEVVIPYMVPPHPLEPTTIITEISVDSTTFPVHPVRGNHTEQRNQRNTKSKRGRI